nr:hypothetical protein [Rhodopirellula sp. SM50]
MSRLTEQWQKNQGQKNVASPNHFLVTHFPVFAPTRRSFTRPADIPHIILPRIILPSCLHRFAPIVLPPLAINV